MRFIVRDSLRYGKAEAIASKPLAEALGFRSVRELQKQIERERSAGAVILSDPCGGGYYLSNDPAELLRFTRTFNARARNTIKAAQSAQMALDAATGQKSIEGWYE
jgi:predicted DNA-binding transcriptional regulator YafY